MNTLSLQLAKVIAKLTAKGWSQIHTFCPQEEKAAVYGQLLAVFVFRQPDQEKAETWGKEVITRFHEEYYSADETGPLLRLKTAIQKVNNEVRGEGQLEVTAAVLINKVLYLAILGRGQATLRRQGEIAAILTGDDTQIRTASGFLESQDLLLLGSADFFQKVPESIIKQALFAGSANEAAEILAPPAHEVDDQSLVAGLVVKVEESLAQTGEIQKPKLPEAVKISKTFQQRLIQWPAKLGQKLRLSRIDQRVPDFNQIKKQRSRKMLLTVALVLFLILVASVFLGRQKRLKVNQEQKFGALLIQVQSEKEEGEAIIELNPVRAKELLLNAQEGLKQARSQGADSPIWDQLENELADLLPQVLKEREVEPETFFDLVLIKEGAQADDAVLSEDKILILDQAKASLYRINLEDRKQAIFSAGDQFKDGQRLAAAWPQVFVLTDKGVLQIDKEGGRPELTVTVDGDKTIDLAAFNRNLYLLDEKTIWQYAAADEGFADKKEWLKSKINLTGAVSMAIDGSIWVLKQDGTILKLTRGQKEVFGIAGLDKPFSSPKVIFTDENSENLYILDQVNARVVVLAKSGEYQAQYLWPGLNEVVDLVASEKQGKILLFSANKISAIEIK